MKAAAPARLNYTLPSGSHGSKAYMYYFYLQSALHGLIQVIIDFIILLKSSLKSSFISMRHSLKKVAQNILAVQSMGRKGWRRYYLKWVLSVLSVFE
ncbi:MAG: hypothetical protein QXT70_03120 [Thermofilaceae archaeon]